MLDVYESNYILDVKKKKKKKLPKEAGKKEGPIILKPDGLAADYNTPSSMGEQTEQEKRASNAKKMDMDSDQQNTNALKSLRANLIHMQEYKKQTDDPVRKANIDKQIAAIKIKIAQMRAGAA